jgi:hypothetical protein
MYGAILNEPLHDAPAHPGNDATETECATDAEVQMGSNVEHPAHYNAGKIEAITVIEDWQLGFCEGNALKYICRAAHTGRELEDLQKARWYLDRRIAALAINRRTSHPDPQPASIQQQKYDPEASPLQNAVKRS